MARYIPKTFLRSTRRGESPCRKNKQHAYNRINNPLHHNMRIAWVGFIDSNHKRVHFGNSRFFGENEQINTLNRRSRNSVGKNVFMLPR